MATLYELNKLINDFEFEIDEETGEILNAEALDEIELAKEEKIENIALYIKNLKSDADAYKKEKDSFYQKEKQAKAKADRLKEYLEAMLLGEKFKSDRVTISYRKSERLDITDGAKIPEIYLKYSEPQVDKVAIKDAIKAGAEIEGCTLNEYSNMQIK